MIEQFLQKKIADLLGEFVEFQKSKLLSMQGIKLSKSKIKPKLVQIISQILGMPLQLNQGIVQSIKLNMPWQKLFLIKDSSIKLQMQGFKLRTKLKNRFNETFNIKARQQLIKHLTSKLITSQQSTSPMVKRLKEFFMDTLELEIKDIQVQIQVQLQHKIDLIFSFQSIIGRQQHKTNTLRVKAQKFAVSYKVSNSKPQPLLYPTNMQLTRQKHNRKTQIVSQKSVNIQTIHLNINNHNFNDIRRFLVLVSWQNSFMHLPVHLWKDKPLPLIKSKPIQKLRFYARLVLQNIRDRTFRKTLEERKNYNTLYSEILKGSKDVLKVKALAEIQDKMYVWRIVAYRNFCIEKWKEQIKRKSQENQKKIKLQQIPEKDISAEEKQQILKAESKLNGFSWLKPFFRSQSNQKELIEQLQQKLNKIQTIPSISALSISVKQILVNVVIITYTAKQNFLLAKALDINFNYEHDDDNQTQRQELICGKFRIQYEEYLGHDKKYACLLQTQRDGQIHKNFEVEQSQEQFQEIQNFLQFRNYPQFKVHIEPLKICINHEIIERLSVFDFQRVQNFSQSSQMKIVKHMDPYLVLKQMNKSFSPRYQPKQIVKKIQQMSKKFQTDFIQQKIKYIQTGIQIIIPQQMAKQLCPCNEIVFQIEKIECRLIGTTKTNIQLNEISFKANFPQQHSSNYEVMLGLGQPRISNVTFVYPFSIKVQQTSVPKEQTKTYEIQINKNIVVDFQQEKHLQKLIKILYLLKPTSKQTRNLYRMKMKRKQSIGQEFIDACENLNQHIVKSAISVMEPKQKKYFPLSKKLKKYSLKTKSFNIKLEQADIDISPLSLRVDDQGIDGVYISSEQQKRIRFEVYQVKKFAAYLGKLSEGIKKTIPHSESSLLNPSNEDESNDIEKKDECIIQNINFQLNLYHQKSCFLKVQLSDMRLEKFSDRSQIQLHLLTKFKNGSNKENKQNSYLPLIQKTKMIFTQRRSYNNISRELRVFQLSIDITPQIVKFLTKLYRIYLESLQSKIKIQNLTLNSVKVNVTGNRYVELKPFETESVLTEKDCNVILFGNKVELSLRNQYESHALTQNCSLIKTQKKLKYHTIESNIKIVNLQDRTIWVSIKENILDESGIFPPRTNEIIDIKYLSAAKSFDLNEGHLSDRPRGNSIHRRAYEKEENSEKINMALKSKEEYNVLINNEDEYLQIIDQGVTFKEVRISQIFKKRQIILSDEDEQYLVLKCSKTFHKDIVYYKLEILSPIYIVNKLPWKISYRIDKESVDVQEMVNTQGRIIRKRSFNAIPLQKIIPLEHNKIRTILFREINDLHITLDEFSGSFKIQPIIDEMLRQKGPTQKYQQSQLICLSNGKKNIQLILKLQISDQTLKIKVYPQYVFVNLCQTDVFFKVKQTQYTYPQIKLKTIKDLKKGHHLTKQQQQIQSFVKTYISLPNQRYNQKQILQQLFQDFEEKIEIFAGMIHKNMKRYFVYESGTKLESSSSGYTSAGGYTSGSDAKEHVPKHTISQLCNETVIEYGQAKSLIYYRHLKIEEYFNLVIFTPTINVINKSNSIFMIKSKANKRLIKVEGQEMNYLTVNSEGFSVQALDQGEQVNLNEWFNINASILGTVYYAKELASNGYESKEYTLRKKKLRKRPKLFYRIVLSQHQRGTQVLIEQSQYPPISFINKTHLRLKISEENETFEEQLGPSEMAQFASIKNPYLQPQFKLYYAEHYQYLFVENFTVDEFRVIPCSKSSKFVISVEEFRDKKIVVFGDEKLMQMSEIKNQIQIQKVQRFSITIDAILLSFMNEHFKEFCALRISNVQFQQEEKNNKQYFKFRVNDIEGYDYSSIHPSFTFQKLSNIEKSSQKIIMIQPAQSYQKSIFSSNVVISYHKNATIVQKCHMRLSSLKIIFNSYLILQSIKVYQNQILSLISLLTMYKSPAHSKISHNNLMKKEFIFESFVWEGTSLTLKCLNLNILCIFLDKNYYKWIIKFLEWVGDLKPIKFSSHLIQYENYTIDKLIKRIDIKKKGKEFANILFEYPMRQLVDISSMFLGQNEKSSAQKMRIMAKIAKGLAKFLFNSGLIPGVPSRSIQTDQRPVNYRQQFQQTHSIRTSQTILDKIKFFEFAQWKYEESYSKNKLTVVPINRLQRYNLKNVIIEYDVGYAGVKLALDSFCGNKIHRKIQCVEYLTYDVVLGLTEEFTVIFFCSKLQWKVKKHEQIINMALIPVKLTKNSLNLTNTLQITTTFSDLQLSQLKNKQPNQLQQKHQKSKLDVYTIINPLIRAQKLKQIKKYIQLNKLIGEF